MKVLFLVLVVAVGGLMVLAQSNPTQEVYAQGIEAMIKENAVNRSPGIEE